MIERFHISQNLHKSILPITGVYLNMNRGTLSRASLACMFVFFLPRRTKFYDFSCFLHDKALPFFAEYRSETILHIGFKSAGKSSAAVAKIAESKVFNLCAVRCFPVSENENK